jgi:hypothetical protein
MGYTLTRASVIRNKAQLDQLLDLKTDLKFPTKRPDRLAYKLREAIRAAALFEEYSQYAVLKDMYVLRETASGVLAEYRPVDPTGEPIMVAPEQVKATPVTPESKTVPDAISLMEILGFIMHHPKEHEVSFPNASLSRDDKVRLSEWTRTDAGEKWSFIDHDESGLTLTKKKVPADVIWKDEPE